MTGLTFQSLPPVSPDSDFASRYDDLRNRILSSLAIPAQALTDYAHSFSGRMLAATYAFGRMQEVARQRLLADFPRLLVRPLMLAQLPRQLRRRLSALLRAGSSRTSRLRKKRQDAVRKARRLFWAYFGLPHAV